jgi:hypothetical protein
MSKTDLTAVANATSPPEVQIPESWQALIVWAVAKFGTGILLAVVLAVATVRVYEDLTILNNRVLHAFEQQTKTAEAHNAAIREMTNIIRNIEADHRKYTTPR